MLVKRRFWRKVEYATIIFIIFIVAATIYVPLELFDVADMFFQDVNILWTYAVIIAAFGCVSMVLALVVLHLVYIKNKDILECIRYRRETKERYKELLALQAETQSQLDYSNERLEFLERWKKCAENVVPDLDTKVKGFTAVELAEEFMKAYGNTDKLIGSKENYILLEKALSAYCALGADVKKCVTLNINKVNRECKKARLYYQMAVNSHLSKVLSMTEEDDDYEKDSINALTFLEELPMMVKKHLSEEDVNTLRLRCYKISLKYSNPEVYKMLA